MGKIGGIRDLLKSSLTRSFPQLSDQDRLEMAWILVCGPALAARSNVIGYCDSVVTIEVGERRWLEEIRNIDRELVPELARVAGLQVAKLHLVVKR
jgi:hypothetical protein